MPNTNLNLYRSFIAAFETKSVRRAAMRTLTTHSAVSQNLKELSKQLGVRLFTPNVRGVEPTSDAITLYPTIKAAVDMINAGENNIREFTPKTHAVIRLAAPSTVVSHILADYFKEFNKKYPNITFEFYDRRSFELLEQNNIDLIIGLEQHLDTFNTIHLFSEKSIFIASKDMNLDTITKEELVKLPIIGHGEFLNLLDLDLNILMQTVTSESVLAMVQKGLGVGYYYERALKLADNSIVEVKIKNLMPPIQKTVVAFNQELSKPAQAFVDGLIKFCKEV